jgi:hypothetical protein
MSSFPATFDIPGLGHNVEPFRITEVLCHYWARGQFAGICEYRGEFESGRDGQAEVLCGAVSDNKNPRFTGISSLLKPSGGLEPPTPSLPCASFRNWWQPTATVFACFYGFRADPICPRLPPFATTGLHKDDM